MRTNINLQGVFIFKNYPPPCWGILIVTSKLFFWYVVPKKIFPHKIFFSQFIIKKNCAPLRAHVSNFWRKWFSKRGGGLYKKINTAFMQLYIAAWIKHESNRINLSSSYKQISSSFDHLCYLKARFNPVVNFSENKMDYIYDLL